MDYYTLLQHNPQLVNNENAFIKIITDQNRISRWVEERKEILADKGDPVDWADIGIVFDNPQIVILRDLVMLPSGKFDTYFRILNHADLYGGQGTAILPLFQGKIVVLRQFRHPTRSWHWEIPRGFGEPNITPRENVELEIKQEIGGVISRIVALGPYHDNTGLVGSSIGLFLTELSSIGDPNVDEGIKEYRLFEIAQFEQMIANAEITDGFSIASFTRARLRNLL